MSGPLNFAFGILGAACVGSLAFSGSVDGLLTQIASAERTDRQATVGQPAASNSYAAAGTTITADRDGHFRVNLRIEGKPISAMVDTGASLVAISYEDAKRIGLYVPDSAPKARASTANGVVTYSVVRLRDVRLNGITLNDVEGGVMPPGALRETLLGMSFLRKLGKFEMQRGRLVMEQ